MINEENDPVNIPVFALFEDCGHGQWGCAGGWAPDHLVVYASALKELVVHQMRVLTQGNNDFGFGKADRLPSMLRPMLEEIGKQIAEWILAGMLAAPRCILIGTQSRIAIDGRVLVGSECPILRITAFID